MERRVLNWRILGGIWLVFLWLVLTLPMEVSEDYGSYWPLWLEGYGDKVVHFSLFLVNGFFLDRMIHPRGTGRSLPRVALIFTLGLALGLATEWVQRGVVGRTAEVLDFLADGAGSGLYSVFSMRNRSRLLKSDALTSLLSFWRR